MTAIRRLDARDRTAAGCSHAQLAGKIAIGGFAALIAVLGACRSSSIAAEETRLAAGAKPSTASPAQSASDAWRYEYHDGRWWYWMPSNSWAWYDGLQWIAFEQDRRSRIDAILVQRPARGESPERYQSGALPAPPGALEDMQDEVADLKQTLRQLERRLREQEAAGSASAARPWSSADEARLCELWQVRQAAIRFYDLHSDSYYFNGKGHFTD